MQSLEQDLLQIEKMSTEIFSLLKQGVKDFSLSQIEKRQILIEAFFINYGDDIGADYQHRLTAVMQQDSEISQTLIKEQHQYQRNQSSRNKLKIYQQTLGDKPF